MIVDDLVLDDSVTDINASSSSVFSRRRMTRHAEARIVIRRVCDEHLGVQALAFVCTIGGKLERSGCAKPVSMQDHDGEGHSRQTKRYKSCQNQQVPPPGPGACQVNFHTCVNSFFPMFFSLARRRIRRY